MGRKNIILTESQVKRLLENRISEVSSSEIAKILESIECSGDDVKSLIVNKLSQMNFTDIRLKFIGKNDDHDLMYVAYTEGPLFVIYTRSEYKENGPCLNIYRVDSYNKN